MSVPHTVFTSAFFNPRLVAYSRLILILSGTSSVQGGTVVFGTQFPHHWICTEQMMKSRSPESPPFMHTGTGWNGMGTVDIESAVGRESHTFLF